MKMSESSFSSALLFDDNCICYCYSCSLVSTNYIQGAELSCCLFKPYKASWEVNTIIMFIFQMRKLRSSDLPSVSPGLVQGVWASWLRYAPILGCNLSSVAYQRRALELRNRSANPACQMRILASGASRYQRPPRRPSRGRQWRVSRRLGGSAARAGS